MPESRVRETSPTRCQVGQEAFDNKKLSFRTRDVRARMGESCAIYWKALVLYSGLTSSKQNQIIPGQSGHCSC